MQGQFQQVAWIRAITNATDTRTTDWTENDLKNTKELRMDQDSAHWNTRTNVKGKKKGDRSSNGLVSTDRKKKDNITWRSSLFSLFPRITSIVDKLKRQYYHCSIRFGRIKKSELEKKKSQESTEYKRDDGQIGCDLLFTSCHLFFFIIIILRVFQTNEENGTTQP